MDCDAIYAEGYEAGVEHLDIGDCPYSQDCLEYDSWISGYEDAITDAEHKERTLIDSGSWEWG